MSSIIKKRKGAIVALMGPTGVGKTTVMRILVILLNQRRYLNASTAFIKNFHGLSYLLQKSLMGIIIKIERGYAPWYLLRVSHGCYTHARYRLALLLSLYFDAFINIPIKLLTNVLIPKTLGKIVFVEDYLYASVIEYVRLIKKAHIKHYSFPLRVLYCLSLKYKPDHLILLEGKICTLVKRWKFRGRKEPQMDYVVFWLNVYKKILPQLHKLSYTINTDHKSPVDVAREALLYILEHINSINTSYTRHSGEA